MDNPSLVPTPLPTAWPGDVTWERDLGTWPGNEAWEHGLGTKPGDEAWERGLGTRPGNEARIIHALSVLETLWLALVYIQLVINGFLCWEQQAVCVQLQPKYM